jgi:hypothetical protein
MSSLISFPESTTLTKSGGGFGKYKHELKFKTRVGMIYQFHPPLDA